MADERDRARWTPAEVTDVAGPALVVRNHREHADLRLALAHARRLRPLRRIADVGCGYGRNAPVLAEWGEVVGFERERALIAQAAPLMPEARFEPIEDLCALPAADGAFDLVVTFTVLQHVHESRIEAVMREICRIVGRGLVLLVEETDPGHVWGDPDNPEGFLTIGRPVERYAALLAPFDLVVTFPRRIEPGYPRADVGTFMLFRHPDI